MADYNLGTARGRVEIDASGVGKGLRDANGQLDQFQNKAGATDAKMRGAGVAMVGAAAGIAAGFGIAIKAASDFESRVSAIAAVSGATEAELETIRKKALQLGADTAFSAGEAAGAMEELIKAGLSVDDVLNGAADATVNLAAAGGVDLVTAATLASNAMNAFNLSAEDMPKVADLIAGAANASAIDVGEFGQSLQQAGAVANLVGLSFDDTALAIAAMGNAGIRGSDAGTSLKTMLQNLQPVTDKQKTLFKELGIVTEDGANQFFHANGEIKSMAEISGVLGGALEGMTKAEKAMALEVMFGTDAIRAAAVIADEGSEGMNALAESMGKVTAQEVAETRMDNLAGSIEQLKGSVETLLIIIGRPLADALRGWVDRITGVINWIGSLDEDTLSLAVTIAKMVGTILGIGGASLIIISYVNKIKAAFVALKVVLLAHPLFFIIAAIVAVGYALYQLYQSNETFRNAVQKLFGWIKANVVPIVEDVIGAVKQLFGIFANRDFEGGPLSEDSPIVDAAFKIRDAITETLIPAIQNMVTWFQANVIPVVISVGTWLTWLGVEVVERIIAGFFWMRDNVFPVFVAFGELLFAIGERIYQFVQAIITIVQTIAPPFIAAFLAMFAVVRGAVGIFIDVVMALWNVFGENIIKAIEIAFNFVKTIVESVLKAIQGIIQVVTGIISGDWSKVWEGIKNIAAAVWDAIFAIIRAAIELVKNTIDATLNALKALWSAAWGAIGDTLKSAWDRITSAVTTAIEAVIQFFRELPGRIIGALAALGQMLFDHYTAAVRRAANAVAIAALEIFRIVREIPGKIIDALGNLGDMLYDAGRAIIRGLINGIKSLAGGVKDAVGGVISGARDLLPFSPAKEGPFSGKGWTTYSGASIIEGLIEGLQREMPSLRAAMKDTALTMHTPLTLTGTAFATEAPAPSVDGRTILSIGKVEIPAKDLEEMRTIQDFFDRVEQVARQGVEDAAA